MYDRLTKGDIEKMQREIDERKLVLRKQLIGEVQEARAQGDLSENFEYYAAKRAKNQNESRIRYLERMIRTAQVIEDRSAADEVGLGKSVTIYITEDDEEETYKIVTSIRGDSMQGRISDQSPLGRALMGHRIGDTVRITVNENYSNEAVIRRIETVPDDNSDGIRQY